MLALTVSSWWLAWRRRLFSAGWFLRACTWAIPSGYVAVTAGWVTTEVGRQPWAVYGHLRTADAVTPNLSGGDVVVSLALYAIVYAAVFGAGAYYLVKLVRAGPAGPAAAAEQPAVRRPARPLSAAQD
jgi:cytochrome d ubiquinol oxidase subunit I